MFPKTLGAHPTDGRPVTANKGKFGPYVSHGQLSAPIPGDVQPEVITLDHAVQVSARDPRRHTWPPPPIQSLSGSASMFFFK